MCGSELILLLIELTPANYFIGYTKGDIYSKIKTAST